ncbi:hypothetical protein RSOLAG22IIIB_10845 [Rhizoctonia solani]|uniref:Uncharacterized protein n=1 Tax=Rhizoctonia solani TaxID=456999 RepID=A0A0K6G4Q7_9AGAM|nr:hypothetical protein RSOLAG22IIIB_10845 [Rhizoctonia solani]
MPDTCTRNLSTSIPKEDPSLSPIDIPASGGTNHSVDDPLKHCLPDSKRLRTISLQTSVCSITGISLLDFKGNPTSEEERESILMEWCQWIVKDLRCLILWLLHTTLGLWGITIWTLEMSPFPLVAAEDQLERALARLERLEESTRSDLEQFANELHSMINDESAIWYRDPWADIRNCVTQHIEFDIVTESERLGGTIRSGLKGQHEVESLSISAFQQKIIGRIKLQAKEVESAWLGTAATIEAELEGMLSEVWKMIRDDDGFDITKGKEQELQSGSTNPVVASVVEQHETRPENAGTEERESHEQGSSDQRPNSPVDLALLTNASIQPISEIDPAYENKFPNINVDNSTSGHIHSRTSSIVNTNNSPISHPAVETQGKTSASHEQQDTGSGIGIAKPRDSTGAREPLEDLTSPGDSEYRPSVLVERSRVLKSRTGIIGSEGTIPEVGLTYQGAVQGLFKAMVKSTSYIGHFRHQCIALIQIYRHFWTMVEITDGYEYQSLHRFGIIADHALETIAGTGPKKQNKASLQEELNKAIVGLEEYCETLSGFKYYDPISLMRDARVKDQERSLKLKQIPAIKAEVDFYIHDGSEFSGRIRRKC